MGNRPWGTLEPAGALDNGGGDEPGLAEQFQCDAGAHDVHDGIDRADFVKVDFLWWLAVNFSFCDRNALEDVHGLLFDPIREPRCPG